MTHKTVRVIVHATPNLDKAFEFRLIFDDNYEKYVSMTEHEFRAWRASERDVIEQAARDYYNDLEETVEQLSLVFL